MVRDLLLMKVQVALGEASHKDDQFAEVIEYFEQLRKPNIYDPHDDNNVIGKIEKEFEESVNVMEDQGHYNPKELTEYSYYHKVLFLQKKFKAQTNAS